MCALKLLLEYQHQTILYDDIWAIVCVYAQEMTGDLYRVLNRDTHHVPLVALTVFPDGNIVSAARNGTVFVWTPSSGTYTEMPVTLGVHCLFPLQNDRLAISCSGMGVCQIRIVDVYKAQCLVVLDIGNLPIYTICSSGKYIVTASTDTITIWDGTFTRRCHCLKVHHMVSMQSLSDEHVIYTNEHGIFTWKYGESNIIKKVSSQVALYIAELPGHIVAVSLPGAVLEFYRICGFQYVGRIYVSGNVSHLSLSPDGKLLTGYVNLPFFEVWDICFDRGFPDPLIMWQYPYAENVGLITTFQGISQVVAADNDGVLYIWQ